MGTAGRDTSDVIATRGSLMHRVVDALAAVAPPARDRDAAAEAAAIVRWARVRDRAPVLAAELDSADAASRLVSLLTRIGTDDGAVRGDSARGRWRVEVPRGTGVNSLPVRLGLTDSRGRSLPAPPSWLTGGSLPGAVATWRGALLARATLTDDTVTLPCPTPGAALALAETGLRLGVRVHRDPAGTAVTVHGRAEVALLLTTCGGRVAAAVAGLDDEDPGGRTGSANDARATVAASRANAAVEEAFATLTRAGVDVPDVLAGAGRLRLAHPDLGLAELAARADPPLSKDALAGRLRRLVTLAGRHR